MRDNDRTPRGSALVRRLGARAALFAATLLCHGCGGAKTPTASSSSADDVAPYPYTVAEIRSSCHNRVIEYRVETPNAPAKTERWVFDDVDAETARITTTTLGPDGNPTGAPEVESAKWSELHEHARFPRAATTISNEVLTVPAGTFTCTRYAVKSADTVVKTYWFGRNLAGPPVKLVVAKGEQPVMTMTMVATRGK